MFCSRLCTGTRSSTRTPEPPTAPLNEVIFDAPDGGMRQPLITSNMSLGGSEQL